MTRLVSHCLKELSREGTLKSKLRSLSVKRTIIDCERVYVCIVVSSSESPSVVMVGVKCFRTFAHIWRAKYFDSRLLYGGILELKLLRLRYVHDKYAGHVTFVRNRHAQLTSSSVWVTGWVRVHLRMLPRLTQCPLESHHGKP
jgi:hypothetical protein